MTQPTFETLHIINKSLTDKSLYLNCIDTVLDGDAIVLIESAIFSLLDTQFEILTDLNIPLYALEIDITARGLTSKTTKLSSLAVSIIDDDKFVQLCCQYKRSISWF